MKKLSVTIFCFVLLPNILFADDFDHDFKGSVPVQIFTESENYIVIHNSNWNINDRYAYIVCINKSTNETIFHVESPFLTHLFISPDEEYIAGISYHNYLNSHQLIILNINGEYIKKRHISFDEAKLNHDEFHEFMLNFPIEYALLESSGRIFNITPYYYIDYDNYGYNVYGENGISGKDVVSYLTKYKVRNHLTNNLSNGFAGTEILLIVWFYMGFRPELTSHMDFQFIYNENEFTGISLLFSRSERININVIE